MGTKITIFWFRRDLRLHDNTGLAKALEAGFPVMPIFIFDPQILDALEDKHDQRLDYIHQSLEIINDELKLKGSRLSTYYNAPEDVFKSLQELYDVQAVYCNRDYEPAALRRDKAVYHQLEKNNIPFKGFKDQVIFDRTDILKADNTPYTVFTPYAKRWKANLQQADYLERRMPAGPYLPLAFEKVLSLQALGFEKTAMKWNEPFLNAEIIENYAATRDYPALQQTSQLGIAFRFGTMSIRQAVAFALLHSEVWLSELIWREFFMQILFHFPQVQTESFRPKYDFIKWRNVEVEFECWCSGNTGYPLVDAGMRQLNQTGYMHNRVRMLTASFLCKHLLIDWRWGEAYFARKLNDYDLAANNGNWQWAAGSGCDAAPYFRVFSPEIQLKKFDKDLKYVRQWVPEYGTTQYPDPMVEHSFARERALKVYAEALKE